MSSIITMRLIFILLALGMLLGVRGQVSMFDQYWFNEYHGQGYGLRALVPVGSMLVSGQRGGLVFRCCPQPFR